MQTNEAFRATVMSVWEAVSAKIGEVKETVSGIDFSGIFDGLVTQAMSFAPAIESAFAT